MQRQVCRTLQLAMLDCEAMVATWVLRGAETWAMNSYEEILREVMVAVSGIGLLKILGTAHWRRWS